MSDKIHENWQRHKPIPKIEIAEPQKYNAGWNAAMDKAASIVLADCITIPKTEYQHQYNLTLRHTANAILKEKK